MYLTLVSIAAAVAIGIGTWLLGAGWFGATLLALVAFVATWIVGVRRLHKRITPGMAQVQRQVEAGLIRPAIATLKDMLRYGRWIPLLEGQLQAQIGVLAYHGGDREEAVQHLEKAGRRSADAQMLLAAILVKQNKTADAIARLQAAEPFNRKHGMLFNFHAWLLAKEGKVDEAMVVLNTLLKKDPSNQITRDNLLRLQNGNRMTMKPFDVQWYALGLERPPVSMGELRQGRKGFRQPPKRRR